MELTVLSLITAVVLVLVFLALLTFLILSLMRYQTRNQELTLSMVRLIQQNQSKSTETLETLLDKALGLLGTKDPLSFQQVQTMNSLTTSSMEPRDNSDQAEQLRWIEDNEQLTDQEKELYRDADYNLG